MPDAQKLLMLLDLLKGEPAKIAQRIAGEEYNTRSYLQVWHTLEEHYGGLNRAKKDILHKLETFPKITKFNKDNALEFSSLLLNILNKYTNLGPGLVDEGGVLSSLAKKVVPEHEVVTYFQKIAEYNRPDNLREFYNFIEQKRIALNLAAAHFAPAPKLGSGGSALAGREDEHPLRDEQKEDINGIGCAQQQKDAPPQKKPSDQKDQPRDRSERGEDPLTCPVCKAKHKLFQCDDFKALPTNKKYYVTRDAGYCYHCLGPNHSAKACSWHRDVKCGIEGCTRYHHQLLHNFKAQMLCSFEEFVGVGVSSRQDTHHSATQFSGDQDYVSIRTATVLLTGPSGKPHRCIAALDTCSNSTNIDADLAKELGFRVNVTGLQREINTMERVVNIASDHVSFMIGPIDGRTSYPVDAYTVRDLVSGTPVINWREAAKDFTHLQKADIPATNTNDKVQILLGADYMYLMAASSSLIGRENEPTAEHCKLGWAFAGRVKKVGLKSKVSGFNIFMMQENNQPKLSDQLKKKKEDFEGASFQEAPQTGLQTYLALEPTIDFENDRKLQELHDLVAKHWELEAIGLVERIPTFSGDIKEKSVKHWTKAERESDAKLKVQYIPEKKQFQMSIPWKQTRPDLPNNRFSVRSRQEKVFARYKDEEKVLITKLFDSYLEKGYIRKIEEKEKYDVDAFYLPFFCVIKADSETTPVRIVWDCAAEFEHHGVKKSLNSEIELTPNRLQDLFKLLLRMRKYKNVVLSDISEMFLKVILDPEDRRYHRFHFNGEEYERLVILFGNLASPNGSQKVI
jgi:hypothetical protein